MSIEEKMMGRKNRQFKSEELKSRQEVAAFLKELAEKIEVNRLVLSRGADNVSLNIPDTISLGILSESKKKKGKRKHSLELEIEWLEEITSPTSDAQPVPRPSAETIYAVKAEAAKLAKSAREIAAAAKEVATEAKEAATA
jgi:amphi-Trp domain-containing protein